GRGQNTRGQGVGARRAHRARTTVPGGVGARAVVDWSRAPATIRQAGRPRSVTIRRRREPPAVVVNSTASWALESAPTDPTGNWKEIDVHLPRAARVSPARATRTGPVRRGPAQEARAEDVP